MVTKSFTFSKKFNHKNDNQDFSHRRYNRSIGTRSNYLNETYTYQNKRQGKFEGNKINDDLVPQDQKSRNGVNTMLDSIHKRYKFD